MFHRISSIIRFLARRNRFEKEVDSELRFHLERQTEENIRRGMPPEEARLAARRILGGVEQVKEQCREARTGRIIESAIQDVRYGVRALVKNPGFACATIVILALGIGVNTAIFSVVYGVFLRPLPYRNGSQVVVIHQIATHAHIADVPFSFKEIQDYRGGNRTLAGVVEHHSMQFLLLGNDTAERVQTGVVSANFFDVLGVKPLLGRTFTPSDDRPNADAVLILSYKYWQTRHGGDPNIVGKVFQMNNRPHTVIGVLPPIPQYPVENEVYMPTWQCPFRSSQRFMANRQARMMTAFGLLKPGVPLKQAQADLSTIAGQLQKTYPEVYPKGYGYGVSVASLEDDLTRRARTTFLVLLGAAGFVLLIACANAANLLLARLLRIERELAVRTALGASRMRLVRQLLTESLLLSLGGGALGLALAPPAVHLLVKFAERFTTRATEVKLDLPVLLFAFAVSVTTGILFGLAPAFSSSRQIGNALSQAGTRTTASRGRQRLRGFLLVAQIAVSFILLVGAGLMIRSFIELERVRPGFSPERLLAMRLSFNFSRYQTPAQYVTLAKNILHQVKDVGGVESAALASNFPFNPGGIASGPSATSFEIEGKLASLNELHPIVDITIVSSEYFTTIRQPILGGRDFTEHDQADTMLVGIINQTLARHRWPSEEPIGKRVTFDHGQHWVKIVGIAGDVREYGLDHAPGDEIYLPAAQNGGANDLVVRSAVEPLSLAALVRSAVRRVDPQIAMDRVNSVASFEEESVAPPRVLTALLSLFAALALLISSSGIAAMMALSVTQRTHEVGIRLALGARRNAVLSLVMRQGLRLAIAGTVVGIVGAIAFSRLMSALLFATSPTDISTFVSGALFFLAIAAVACLIPARQVTRIDPVIALRQE